METDWVLIMFEMIITPIIVGMGIVLYVLIRNDNDAIYECVQLNKQINDLQTRIAKLENEARYIADQPQQSYYSNSMMALQNAYETQTLFNEVPINDVVKAIVKHLDMQIEKVAEQTTKKPMEIKLVEKQPHITIIGSDGMRGATWESREPLQKPKRKYTKRKTK
jgi:hypothetical protein